MFVGSYFCIWFLRHFLFVSVVVFVFVLVGSYSYNQTFYAHFVGSYFCIWFFRWQQWHMVGMPVVVRNSKIFRLLEFSLFVSLIFFTWICRLKKTLGKTRNRKLSKMLEINKFKPLPISFDVADQKTFRPVGPLAKDFKSLLEVTLRNDVPLTFDYWEIVPAEHKTAIWPQIEVENV